jgi:phosphoglycolate phosphatase-like HAD superfamily hydrolase
MPGVRQLLEKLNGRSDVLLGLLTGNIEAGARAKLSAAGLLGFFRVGAYGSDHAERRRLPAIACDRARALARQEFPVERTVIVGDTPLDIDCAQACSARSVAVATGQHSAEELRACTPHLLVADFSDVEEVVRALTAL